MDSHRFAFAFDPLLAPTALLIGVTPFTSSVVVDAHGLHVRFGLWRLHTPLDNIAGTEVSGPYTLVKVIGPPRLSFVDQGVTFATNRSAGVCIRFHEPVTSVYPGGPRHPGATVTVDDPDRLAQLFEP